jgi:hypothetical protein
MLGFKDSSGIGQECPRSEKVRSALFGLISEKGLAWF